MAITERFVSSLAGGGGDGAAEGTAWTFAEMLTNLVAGERANVKADGAYTLAGAGNQTFTALGATTTLVFIVRGYTTTIGDGGRPTITATIGWFDWSTVTDSIFVQNMIFKGSNTTNPTFQLTNGSHMVRTDVENTSATFASDAVSLDNGACAIGCSVKIDTSNAVARAIVLVDIRASAIECAVKSSQTGIAVNEGTVARCLVVSGGTTGLIGIHQITGSLSARIVECTVFDFTDLIAITNVAGPSSSRSHMVLNNVLYQGTNGLINNDVVEKTKLFIARNFVGGVSTQYSGIGDVDPIDTVALGSNPFVDSAGDNFSLNDVANGGLLVQGAALQVPALIP